VQQILAADEDADDLRWLYSNADEYSPSDLTGRPVPTPGLPERGGGSPRQWDPRWHKFGVANYVLTGAGLGIAVASSFVPVTSPWPGTNTFDEWGRRTLSARDYESGQWARDTSDVLLSITLAFPFLVDSLSVAYWYRRSPEVATQTALIAAEAIAVSTLLQGTTSALAQRERPYGRDCGGTVPGELSDCTGSERYRSFFSGHTSMSFAAAAVTCTHHARFELFGDPAADAAACGASMASATAVGLFRVVGMKHYLTDVLTGAAAGAASGFAVPWLLHYGPLARTDSRTTSGVNWSVYPMLNGMAVRGTF
jgi:membrane-associated phospholipid phosphatase